MNENSPTTASTGAASGSITPQKTCAGVAPSTRADSSSSAGIVSKKPFISHVFTPMRAAEVDDDQPGQRVQADDAEDVADVEDDQVDRDDERAAAGTSGSAAATSIPMRRPLKRKRLNAYAASAPSMHGEDRGRRRDDHRVQVPAEVVRSSCSGCLASGRCP